MGATQSHQSDPRVLGRRTLERDHWKLAALLRPGMSVLDAGCGTGAITAGIRTAVGPTGDVIGVDRDATLLDIARREVPDCRFIQADLARLDFDSLFDVVNSARTLQWIPDPQAAVQSMFRAAKPGGFIVVLDYNHEENTWDPDPPEEFQSFYRAFLKWRAANGWTNQMAERLPEIFGAAGLVDIESVDADETAGRGEDAAGMWLHVIETIGPRIVAAGFLQETESSWLAYREWIARDLNRQTLRLRAVVGKRPGGEK